jgi:DNA-binding response OmpR family regulator
LYFASVNIEPIVFTNPLIALDHFKQCHHRYTVALINSRLSNLEELELARKMRRYNSDIKVLLLKAHHITDPSQNTKYGEAGVSEVLSKPISIDKIGSHVISLCTENV